MKKLLLALAIFATIGAQAQNKLSLFLPQFTGTGLISIHQGGINVEVINHADTLEILNYNQIHFIKIGDRVYKLETPTLKEVQENKRPNINYGGVELFTLPVNRNITPTDTRLLNH